jgi:hypothetical protein
MSGINLDFQSFDSLFDFAPGVESYVAETHEPYAVAYLAYLGARPFGQARIHQKAESDGSIKSEKVEAFSDNQFLYVCRTINGITRVFKFFAPTGLLLIEACKISEEHYKMSTLHLQ